MTDELDRAERMVAAALEGAAIPPRDGELPGLRRVAHCFGLSPLERDLVLLLLAVELRPRLAALFDRLTGRGDGRPTVAALAAVLARDGGTPDAVTTALAPGEHLIANALVEVAGDGPFPGRVVRLPDVVWPRLVELPTPLPFPVIVRDRGSMSRAELAPSTRAQAARAMARAATDPARALIVIGGRADGGAEAIATAMAGELGLASVLVTASVVDSAAAAAALRREATWLQAAIVVQGAPTVAALGRLAATVPVPIVVAAGSLPPPDACAVPGRWRLEVETADLPLEERVACWRRHLDGVAIAPDLDLDAHAGQLRFGPARIAAVAAAARDLALADGGTVTASVLRHASRAGATAAGGLARRLDGAHDLRDLVVPAATRRELDLACAWARHSTTALRGIAAGRPLHDRSGLVCLFHGPPGTGKTLAARAIAGELGIDLLRIDLSQVVNKYIGETEKNLDRVFDEADASGAILFFDEADALFGKRTGIKDAHDRYANIETAFLLQRLELHRGMCILASNLRQNLDEAFTRRIQVIAEFPLPGPDERTQIWQRHVVPDHLDRDVDLPALGRRFAISGGDISNAAATALVLAAADRGQVAMRHLVLGVWREIKKSGRLVSAEDFGPWRGVLPSERQ